MNRLRASYVLICILIVGSNYCNAQPALCVKEHLVRLLKEAPKLAIAASDAERLVVEVAQSIGLNRPVTVVPCNFAEKAYAWPGSKDSGTPEAEYIIYNPDWVREVIGQNRFQAVALFGHELAHFLNADFTTRKNVPRPEREADADRFAGCAVAKMGGDFTGLENLLSRIRLEKDTQYPDRLKSVENARAGFKSCTGNDSRKASTEVARIYPFETIVLNIKYSRDASNDFWAGRSDDGKIIVVDSRSGKILRTMKCSLPSSAGLAIERFKEQFVAANCGPNINIYSMKSPTKDFVLKVPGNFWGSLEHGLAWGLNEFVSVDGEGCASTWDLEKRAIRSKLQCRDGVTAVALDSRYSMWLLTGTKNGLISLWTDLGEQPKLRWQVKFDMDIRPDSAQSRYIRRVAFSPDLRQAIGITWSPYAYLIDVSSGSIIKVSHHDSAILWDGVFDETGRLAATAGTDGKVIVWNTQNGTRLWSFEHDEDANRVVFSRNSRYLISTSADKTTRVWSLETGKETSRVTHDDPSVLLDINTFGGTEYVLIGTGERWQPSGAFYIQEWRLTGSGKLVPRQQ